MNKSTSSNTFRLFLISSLIKYFKYFILLLFGIGVFVSSFGQECDYTVVPPPCRQIPIEGYGANAAGGPANTNYYHVKTLEGSGCGSLRYGIFNYNPETNDGHKTIVFDVSGTIYDAFTIDEMEYMTIDGTGQNITIDSDGGDDCLSLEGPNVHHIIIKNIHFANSGGDGANAVDGAHDIAFTNCSFYGNGDGNIDIANGCYNVTIQYCIIGNHIAPLDDGTGGMLITSYYVSVHHNLFNVKSDEEGERCPFVHAKDIQQTTYLPHADIRNNIVYNYGRNNSTGSGYGTGIAHQATANIVNNYYYTPSTIAAINGIDLQVDGGDPESLKGFAYCSGNVSGNGYNFNSGIYTTQTTPYSVASPYQITDETAYNAAGKVLAYAGPDTRNTVDLALIDEVTLPGAPIVVSARAFLQGAYNSSLKRHKNVTIGTSTPWGWASILNQTTGGALAQPYNVLPFNYSGTESVSSGFFTSDDNCDKDIVDWVLVELRDKSSPSTTVVARRAAFIREDGLIVDLDGISPVKFYTLTTADDYYVAIKHRNHLAIRSASALPLTGGSVTTYDFSTAPTQAYKSSSILTNWPMKGMWDAVNSDSVYVLWGGNANVNIETGNSTVRASGAVGGPNPVNDVLYLLNTVLGGSTGPGIPDVYNTADVNMDGTVRASGPPSINDYTFIFTTVLAGNTGIGFTQHL